jgi:hypothetical protein
MLLTYHDLFIVYTLQKLLGCKGAVDKFNNYMIGFL